MRLHRGAPPNIAEVRAVDPSGRLNSGVIPHGMASAVGASPGGPAMNSAMRRPSALKGESPVLDNMRVSSSRPLKKWVPRWPPKWQDVIATPGAYSSCGIVTSFHCSWNYFGLTNKKSCSVFIWVSKSHESYYHLEYAPSINSEQRWSQYSHYEHLVMAIECCEIDYKVNVLHSKNIYVCTSILSCAQSERIFYCPCFVSLLSSFFCVPSEDPYSYRYPGFSQCISP